MNNQRKKRKGRQVSFVLEDKHHMWYDGLPSQMKSWHINRAIDALIATENACDSFDLPYLLTCVESHDESLNELNSQIESLKVGNEILQHLILHVLHVLEDEEMGAKVRIAFGMDNPNQSQN